jgi:adenylylsulfate kinase-like enzyme
VASLAWQPKSGKIPDKTTEAGNKLQDNLSPQPGQLIWITGLAGAGKSTVSRALTQALRQRGLAVVRLDGDTLRPILAPELGYALADRQEVARRISLLCQLLVTQGSTVVCATISLFHACQAWNRSQIPRYTEVLLQASPETLRQRDPKGLYSQSPGQVMGQDLRAEFPLQPELRLDNNGQTSPADLAAQILSRLEF